MQYLVLHYTCAVLRLNVIIAIGSFSAEILSLPPANEVCKGYVFTRVCQSFCSQGGAWSGGLVRGVPAPRGCRVPGGL